MAVEHKPDTPVKKLSGWQRVVREKRGAPAPEDRYIKRLATVKAMRPVERYVIFVGIRRKMARWYNG